MMTDSITKVWSSKFFEEMAENAAVSMMEHNAEMLEGKISASLRKARVKKNQGAFEEFIRYVLALSSCEVYH